MNKIVRERYPVEKLPEDLRSLLDPSLPVTLVLEQAARLHDLGKSDREFQRRVREEAEGMPLTGIVEEMQDRRVFSDDPVERIRALRSEWDGRDAFHDRIRTNDDD
jgi:hypothetical protein